MENKVYLCIDLKSFYASVECVERGYDPYKVNLVVADNQKGDGSICLAVSPSLKEKGVKGRPRLFEIPKDISFVVAKPRMKKYIEYSANIYQIYLKYISKEDIWVYSIDECFMDITHYLNLYNLTAKELALKILKDIYSQTKITATAGIGTNMFLAKVALDIMAKHADSNIGLLDEEEFKKTIWYHQPITDIWNIGHGIAKRLEKYNAYNLYDVSLIKDELLYKEFGVNAEYLIDHAKGYEPCTIKDCHEYVSKEKSISNGQILPDDYSFNDAFLVLKEMLESLVLELIEKKLVTNSISLVISYSKNKINSTNKNLKLDEFTNSYKELSKYFLDIYEKSTNKNYPIRKIGIGLNNLKSDAYKSINLFSDTNSLKKEEKMQEAIVEIKKKYGKNAVLKGMNLEEKSTAKKRNSLIGGHNSE